MSKEYKMKRYLEERIAALEAEKREINEALDNPPDSMSLRDEVDANIAITEIELQIKENKNALQHYNTLQIVTDAEIEYMAEDAYPLTLADGIIGSGTMKVGKRNTYKQGLIDMRDKLQGMYGWSDEDMIEYGEHCITQSWSTQEELNDWKQSKTQ